MKNKTLYFSMALLVASVLVNAQTTGGGDPLVSGSCAGYIQFNDALSLQADSIYLINKTTHEIEIDALPESAWDAAFPRVLSKIAREPNDKINILNLDNYPQTEADGHATFRALWTEDGVYMYITVKDNKIRYQNPTYQWENDAIELFFAKARGEGFKQVIIPAMVGTTDDIFYPAPLDFETGSDVGSDPDYKVFGYDFNNWDASVFYWAIRRTTIGYDMEIYLDKDIVTNGNSTTHFGLNKMFAGDVNYDIAGERQNNNTPPLYVRECILSMLGNSNRGYTSSASYGYFKMVDEPSGIHAPKSARFDAIYNNNSKEIRISSTALVSSVVVYSLSGQALPTVYNNASISVSQFSQGIYFIEAKDQAGNNLGVQKVVIY